MTEEEWSSMVLSSKSVVPEMWNTWMRRSRPGREVEGRVIAIIIIIVVITSRCNEIA